MELVIGQRVFLKPLGSAVRRGAGIKEGVIKKVGSKYFYVTFGNGESQFYKDTRIQVSNYSPEWKVYESMEEIEAERRLSELRKEVVFFFVNGKADTLTTEQLAEIHSIITSSSK